MNDEDAIRELIAAWLRETRAGNVDAVLELMAPDVIFLVAGQEPMVGRDAFASQLRAVLREHAVESSSVIEEVVVSGDLAYCRTKLDIVITSKHGNTPMQRKGHTLSVFRKGADGVWRLSRDANFVS